MSVRFDSASDRLLRTTTTINYNSGYAVCFWVYLSSDLNAVSTFFSINDDSDQNEDRVATDTDGVTVQFVATKGGVSGAVTGPVLTIGEWNHIAICRPSANFFVNGVLIGANSHNISGRGASSRTEFGGRFSTDQDRLDGRIAAIKVFSGDISEAQVKAEMDSYMPNFLPLEWYPCLAGSGERNRDYSQLGRNWTESGTLADEPGPPIRWGLEAPMQFPVDPNPITAKPWYYYAQQ